MVCSSRTVGIFEVQICCSLSVQNMCICVVDFLQSTDKAWTVALACSIADLLRKPVAIVVENSAASFSYLASPGMICRVGGTKVVG